jgi:NRAMP (natural resistance-associated macrophage protein)-like metal ion transporter
MNWEAIAAQFERVRTGDTDLQKKIRGLRRRLTLLLAVVGPGLITSNVDNDAGGISVYTQAGAQYGYALLWSLIPMTIALYVTEEMCARMGVVTGKGLSDLIREEFGFRSTFFVMITGFFVDLANVVAEFAGVAAAMQIFGVSRYIAVPIAAMLVWILVIRGTYRQVEVIFLFACVLYLSYVFSAFLAKPDWLIAAKQTVIPNLSFNSGYLLMLTGLVGTTIAPWQFFLYASRVRGKESGTAPISTGARGRAYRQHQLHGDCFLYHRLHRCDALHFGPPGHHGRRASSGGLDSARRQMGGYAVRVWAAQCVTLCRFHFAALDRARDLRRPGV